MKTIVFAANIIQVVCACLLGAIAGRLYALQEREIRRQRKLIEKLLDDNDALIEVGRRLAEEPARARSDDWWK